MISPVQAANPALNASPFPLPTCSIILIDGSNLRASAIVLSTECPSTRITSLTVVGIYGKTWRRLGASLRVGMITLIVGNVGFSNVEMDRFEYVCCFSTKSAPS
jgi:hypothetical protein